MSIEHKDITDPKIHEPKGVSDATDKQAYISNGAGSGVWTNAVVLTDVQQSKASMDIENNTTPFSVSAAVDPTLSTPSDYIQISLAEGITIGSNLSYSTDSISVLKDATYELSVSLSIASVVTGTLPDTIGVAVSDGTSFVPMTMFASIQSSGEAVTISFSKLLPLTNGDAITLWIASKGAANVTIANASVGVKEIMSL